MDLGKGLKFHNAGRLAWLSMTYPQLLFLPSKTASQD